MATEAIGAVRIDITANLATFSRSLKNADKELAALTKQMQRLSERAAKSFDQMTNGARAFERVGKDLARNVTLPLAAFAAAAIKAADPAGKFTERLKAMGVEALVTLQPIGTSLIAAFDAFEPTIRRAISVVGTLAEKFGELSPATQRMIIVAGAAAAAIGPLIIAGAAAAKVGGIAIAGITSLVAVAKTFTFVVAPPMIVAIAGIGAALVGLELGKYFYDEFKIVQTTAAATINLLENLWESVGAGFKILVASIREAWDSSMDFVLERAADVVEKVAGGLRFVKAISKEQLEEANRASAGMRTAYGSFSFNDEYARIIKERNANWAFNDLVYQSTVEQIDADFGGRDRKGQDLLQHTGMQIAGLSSQITPHLQTMKDKFAAFMGDVDRYAATSQERGAVWQRDAEGARGLAKATDDANKAMERMRDEAIRLRLELYPKEKLEADIARVHELAAAFPEILNGPDVQAAIAKLNEDFAKAMEKGKKKIKTWRDEFRDLFKDFGRDASKTFAEFATGADVAFDQVLLSWTRMAIEMAAQQWVFGPAFDKIGTSLFGPESAMGNVFSRGEIIPHAMGGVVSRESYFPMRGGIGSMAEGNKAEAIMPLERVRGRLGVYAAGAGGAVSVQIFDQRSGGQAVQTSESRGPDGERIIRVLVRDEVGRMAGDGGLDRVLGPTFGSRRRPRTR